MASARTYMGQYCDECEKHYAPFFVGIRFWDEVSERELALCLSCLYKYRRTYDCGTLVQFRVWDELGRAVTDL